VFIQYSFQSGQLPTWYVACHAGNDFSRPHTRTIVGGYVGTIRSYGEGGGDDSSGGHPFLGEGKRRSKNALKPLTTIPYTQRSKSIPLKPVLCSLYPPCIATVSQLSSKPTLFPISLLLNKRQIDHFSQTASSADSRSLRPCPTQPDLVQPNQTLSNPAS
jgi:hypothetical protein